MECHPTALCAAISSRRASRRTILVVRPYHGWMRRRARPGCLCGRYRCETDQAVGVRRRAQIIGEARRQIVLDRRIAAVLLRRVCVLTRALAGALSETALEITTIVSARPPVSCGLAVCRRGGPTRFGARLRMMSWTSAAPALSRSSGWTRMGRTTAHRRTVLYRPASVAPSSSVSTRWTS